MATEAQTCAIGILTIRQRATSDEIRDTLHEIRNTTFYAKQSQFPKSPNEHNFS